MTVAESLIAYSAAAGLLTMTPGVDTAMVLRTSTLEGPRRAAFGALGINVGLLTWGAAAAFGLGGLLAASEMAYTALKWVGAAYLVWLGIGMILRPRSALPARDEAGDSELGSDSMGWFMRGLLTNLLNPKVGVFYVTFLPQFVPTGVSVAPWTFGLACIHVLFSAIWCSALIAASAPLGRVLTRPTVVRTMDRLVGGVFIAFGARLVLSRR